MTQSSRTLIAIINARHRKEWRKCIRESWLPQVPQDKADAFFFVGNGEPLGDPEGVVELDCPDTYFGLPEKIKSLCKWAHAKGYERLLKCDDDVMLRVNDYLNSGIERYPYSGRSNRPESPYAVPYGFCYTIDKKCMEIMSEESMPGTGSHKHWHSNDDERWVAETLSQHGILLHDDRRYFLHQYRFPTEEKARRPLRAPKRPTVDQSLWGNRPDQGTVAYCVHVTAELEEKIAEYYKLWARHREY